MDRVGLASETDSLSGLKDFQSASVEALYEGLYERNQTRMLLADEVGLGKTVVARGLIARVLKQRLEDGNFEPFKVTYICSNQILARENLRKLNPLPKSVGMKPLASRIAYLAYEEGENHDPGGRQVPLELNTLTPDTSFQPSSGTGNMSERAAIYAALCQEEEMRSRQIGLFWILKGVVRKVEKDYTRELSQALKRRLRQGLAERFVSLLKAEMVPVQVNAIYTELPDSGPVSLYQATLAFANRVDEQSCERFSSASWYLSRRLRECLVEACLPYVDADLYILDEFQRFRDLLDRDKPHARLAQRVFEQGSYTRILLLSATPFKAFTSYDDVERGEDHYQDFRRVLRFLLRDNEAQLESYEKHRKALYRQILDLRHGDIAGVSEDHKKGVEDVLRSVMCRTERLIVAAPDALIVDTEKDAKQVKKSFLFHAGDIENFRHTDRLVRALACVGYNAGKPVEYCKSALFPMSFLDGYKLKEELRKHRDKPEVARALEQSRNGWIDLERINQYQWQLDGDSKKETKSSGNARLEELVEQAVGPHGAKLLWVPPSLPYYALEDAFTGTSGFTKTLLFSSWVMVPRMISALVSYEVERRTVGDPGTVDHQEVEPRSYFTPDGKRRGPVPQIRYARRTVGGRVQMTNMSNFALLYPSRALADICSPLENLKHGHSLGELRRQLAKKIGKRLREAKLSQYETPGGEGERWYWAAPLLLDRINGQNRETVRRWLECRWKPDDVEVGSTGEEGQQEAKDEHYRFLEACIEDPAKIELGRPPRDLAEVLADLALGSPAVIVLRSLRQLFPEEEESAHLRWAAEIADKFASLFNKPESISAIRLNQTHQWYWRRVAGYCASGCLQAVIDEYLHLLLGPNVSPEVAVKQLIGTINLNVSTINVDSLETFQSGQPKKMRCHYAVEFGSQRIETEEGEKRAAGLREVFNSPFRPFLLSTTSIGQEGLDFHFYCRRVVHWNLPGNPIDLEQREGRINRFKNLAIRQQIARRYGKTLARELDAKDDVWESLFDIADRAERRKTGKCDLVPFWHVETDKDLRIERVIPLYPFSVDHSRLRHILRTLTIYRLAFGQPRQAEMIDHLLERNLTKEEIQQVREKLMIDLSPIGYRNEYKGANDPSRRWHQLWRWLSGTRQMR